MIHYIIYDIYIQHIGTTLYKCNIYIHRGTSTAVKVRFTYIGIISRDNTRQL